MGSFGVLCTLLILLHSEGYLCGDGDQSRAKALDERFHDFMKTHNRTYENQEEANHRFKIFATNMEKSRKLQEEERGTAEYGVTKFSDMSADEFMSRSLKPTFSRKCEKPDIDNLTTKHSKGLDWSKRNAVTPVKNQVCCSRKDCKSCWAFAVVGNIESQWFLKHGRLTSLAEQELIDCTETSNGCSSGHINLAFEDVINLGGLMAETDYSYTAMKGRCQFKSDRTVAKIRSFVCLPKNETVMQQYIATNGPLTALVNAVMLQHYENGILRSNCAAKDWDHAILIVGYGVEGDIPYWIVKNSWGENWGENGYFRLYRGENTCGIKNFSMSAVV
ncbi:cathepsin F-like [Heptranchias perlo]|uniref:cathepsin F-like n=1 Tax=Heptranchias perlo TaxID=212740 RepID=UPI00355A6EA3